MENRNFSNQKGDYQLKIEFRSRACKLYDHDRPQEADTITFIVGKVVELSDITKPKVSK